MNSTNLESFAAVIAVELAVFLIFARISGSTFCWARTSILLGIVFGVPVGLVFDLVVGSTGRVFSYKVPLTPTFVIANGAFSYGLAAATVFVLSNRIPMTYRPITWSLGFVPLVLSCILVIWVTIAAPQAIVAAFLIGIIVLFVGESIAMLRGRSGPILELILGNWKLFVMLWSMSIFLGAAYETANAIWPIWEWGPASSLPRPWWTIMLVTVGYVILVHPLWILGGHIMQLKPESD